MGNSALGVFVQLVGAVAVAPSTWYGGKPKRTSSRTPKQAWKKEHYRTFCIKDAHYELAVVRGDSK